MQSRRTGSAGGGGFFWTLTAIACGLIAGGIFGYVIAYFSGAAPSSGLMVGAVIFIATSWVLGSFAMGGPLPPPNSLPVPTAPPGGRFSVPGGAPTSPRRESEPADAHSVGVSLGETFATARSKITEAMTSAGAAAEGTVKRVSDRVSGSSEDRTEERAEAGGDSEARADAPAEAYEPAYPVVPEADTGPAVAAPATPQAGGVVEPQAASRDVEPQMASGDGEPETASRDVEPQMASGDVEPEAAGGEVELQEPPRFDAPREGGADDLKRITGIGPAIEEKLNGLGIYHYAQIGSWTAAELAWIDQNLEGVSGRAARDGWIEQAARLAAGDEGAADETSGPAP